MEVTETRVQRLRRRRQQEAAPERVYTQREVDALLKPHDVRRHNALLVADALDKAASVMRIRLFTEIAALLRGCANLLRR